MTYLDNETGLPGWMVSLADAYDWLADVLTYLRPVVLAVLVAAAIPVGLFAGCRAVKLIVPKINHTNEETK